MYFIYVEWYSSDLPQQHAAANGVRCVTVFRVLVPHEICRTLHDVYIPSQITLDELGRIGMGEEQVVV